MGRRRDGKWKSDQPCDLFDGIVQQLLVLVRLLLHHCQLLIHAFNRFVVKENQQDADQKKSQKTDPAWFALAQYARSYHRRFDL